jgi:hypothetical protein
MRFRKERNVKRRSGCTHQIDEAGIRPYHRVPLDREYGFMILQRLPNMMLDLRIVKRTSSEHRTIELHIWCHIVQRDGARHQWRHPPRVVRSDDAGAAKTTPLQVCYGSQKWGEPFLLLICGPPHPHRRSLLDHATGEERKGRGVMILDLEPLRMPPFVGFRGRDGMYSCNLVPGRWIPAQPIGGNVPSFFLTKDRAKKYLQSSKWGVNP